MAALPPENTTRYFVDYTTGRTAHTVMFRSSGGVSDAQADGAINFVLDLLMPVCYTAWSVTGCRKALAGSTVTLPVSMPFTEGLTGELAGTLPEEAEPREHRWVGRGVSSGRTVTFSIYGILQPFTADYRIDSGEGAIPWVASTVAALNAGGGMFVTIASDPAVWYPYVSQNNNSYWETDARR